MSTCRSSLAHLILHGKTWWKVTDSYHASFCFLFFKQIESSGVTRLILPTTFYRVVPCQVIRFWKFTPPHLIEFWCNLPYNFILRTNGKVQYINSIPAIISKLQTLYFYPRLIEIVTENSLGCFKRHFLVHYLPFIKILICHVYF